MMMVTYKFKLYAAKRHKELHRVINASGLAYNLCIRFHRTYYKLFHKTLNKYELQKRLTRLKKKEKFAYLKEIPSQALQDITDRIERAYKLFFRNLERKVKCSPPGFRKVKKYRSFTLKQAGYKLLKDGKKNNKIKIGDRIFRYHKSRDIVGKIKTVTIKRDSLNDVYIYFACEVPDADFIVRPVPADRELVRLIESGAGKIVGFDFALKEMFLVASDYDDIVAPQFLHDEMKEIKAANRKLSRKTPGSARYRRAKSKLARMHKRVANRRRQDHYEKALKLVRKYDVIALEDLNLKAMQRRYGKKISDLGFSDFVKILEHMAAKYGCRVVKVGRFFPSSQLCSKCHYQFKGTKDLSVREWECPRCHVINDRDHNAAVLSAKIFFQQTRPKRAFLSRVAFYFC